MCEKCNEAEKVFCSVCGSVLAGGWEDKQGYLAQRREIKNLMFGCLAETFVWVLMFEGRPVKVGYGSLVKLNNETRPNATYIRFDSVWIYWCNTGEECRAFACWLMGNIKGIVNRKGVSNSKYKSKTEMRWVNNVPLTNRNLILGEPDFEIAGIGYWSMDKISQFGVS